MKRPHFNVVVVGSGVTGLSTALHLHRSGLDKVAVLAEPGPFPFSMKAAGMLCGGLSDNFTRLSNAHGLGFAKEIWNFSNAGFDAVMEFVKAEKILAHSQRRVRLIVDTHELRESEQAVQQLNSQGFDATLYDPDRCPYIGDLRSRILAVQDEGERGAWMDQGSFLETLRQHASAFMIPATLENFDKTDQGLVLSLSNDSEITTEFLVLACHTDIVRFLPSLREALVTFADQWSTIDAPNLQLQDDGVVFSAHHGYEWGVLKRKSLHFGGGRYLRPLAGIGAKEATLMPRIMGHLQEQLQKTFSWGAQTHVQHSTPILDIWPCDELPVIGPMFGEDRILLATGYMGTGMSLGFQAGRCLSELITHGRCDRLPRRLWPERLRSL